MYIQAYIFQSSPIVLQHCIITFYLSDFVIVLIIIGTESTFSKY